MRDFRIVAVAYEEDMQKKILPALVNKVKTTEETVMHFGATFDENKVREKLKKVRSVLEEKQQNLGVVVFDSLEYDPSKPAQYDDLFFELFSFAREFDITVIVMLRHTKTYDSLNLCDFQGEYGKDNGIEQDIELLISVEHLHPNKLMARVLKSRCGGMGNYLINL